MRGSVVSLPASSSAKPSSVTKLAAFTGTVTPLGPRLGDQQAGREFENDRIGVEGQ